MRYVMFPEEVKVPEEDVIETQGAGYYRQRNRVQHVEQSFLLDTATSSTFGRNVLPRKTVDRIGVEFLTVTLLNDVIAKSSLCYCSSARKCQAR